MSAPYKDMRGQMAVTEKRGKTYRGATVGGANVQTTYRPFE
jgi:hypothetical protein